MVTLYLLSCEKGKYYIGKTNSIEFRLEEHFNAIGSEWTKIYRPIKVEALFPNCDSFDEDKYTIKYMSIYGISNVRGGTFSKVKLDQQEQEVICKMINGANDRCFLCGSSQHFISDCPEKANSDLATSLLEILIKKVKIPENISIKHKCFKCGREGHFAPDCYAKTSSEGKSLNKPKNRCFRCGREGHYSPDCYAKTDSKGEYLRN